MVVCMASVMASTVLSLSVGYKMLLMHVVEVWAELKNCTLLGSK